MKVALTFLLITVLVSCASTNTPNASLIDTTPVVTIGDKTNVSDDYIVFIPANTEFPVEFSLKGTVFNSVYIINCNGKLQTRLIPL